MNLKAIWVIPWLTPICLAWPAFAEQPEAPSANLTAEKDSGILNYVISQNREPKLEQTQAQLQELQERLQRLETLPLQQIYLGSPGSSSNTPTAYGGSWGSLGVGLSYQERTRYTDESDGSSGVVVSFGNSRSAVGLDVGVSFLDLSEFGDRGAFSFKVHRQLPQEFAVAVGLENALNWGFTDADTSVYGVVSKRFRLQESSRAPFSRLNLSVGIGNGRFRSEDNVQNDEGSVGIFGSAAIQVIKPISVFTEWTGQDLNVGMSVLPFRNLSLVITPTLSDITGTAGDGTRFTLGVGYGLSLF